MTDKKIGFIFLFLLVVVAVLPRLNDAWTEKKDLARAQAAEKKGFFALAADLLEPHRAHLARSVEGCRALILDNSKAGDWVRLESVSEHCLDNQIELEEAYEGLAASLEQKGNLADALKVLEGGQTKFPTASMKRNLIRLAIKAGDSNRPIALYFDLISMAPKDSQLLIEAIQYFARIEKWGEAKMVAQNLEGVESKDPAVFLLLARVMRQVKDEKAAGDLRTTAERLMAQLSAEQRDKIRQAYRDVYMSRGK